MKPGMRMALNAYRQSRMGDTEMREYPPYGNEMRYRMEDESMRMGDMPENRRRRDSRGRFMEYENMTSAHRDPSWYGTGENQQEQRIEHKSNVIGFKPKHEHKHAEGGLDYEKAKKWVEKMGEHFPFEKAKAIMQRVDAMECNPIEFWAVMNSLYSDYGKVLEKFNMDSPEVYGALTKAWLEDEDAVENKVIEYLECIVKK